jgi:hypothetical protein
MFLNKEGYEKKAVAGIRALRWERGYRVGVDKSVWLPYGSGLQ